MGQPQWCKSAWNGESLGPSGSKVPGLLSPQKEGGEKARHLEPALGWYIWRLSGSHEVTAALG